MCHRSDGFTLHPSSLVFFSFFVRSPCRLLSCSLRCACVRCVCVGGGRWGGGGRGSECAGALTLPAPPELLRQPLDDLRNSKDFRVKRGYAKRSPLSSLGPAFPGGKLNPPPPGLWHQKRLVPLRFLPVASRFCSGSPESMIYERAKRQTPQT